MDTNVLAAALIHPGGFCGRLLDLVVDGAVEVCIDNPILAEYAEVRSRRKDRLPFDKIQTTLDFFQQSSTPVIAHPLGVVFPDPDDLPFLEVAASGHATRVTGNRRHVPKAATGTVHVRSPAACRETLPAHL